ncbi:MAG: hypothetical protein HZA77_00040 [Candidatus Schekmanbacteria bacterium]|nr:hypothetical protein [Candidatus Schekmanbacteria bacterium]
MNKRKSLLILLIFPISLFLLGFDYSTDNITELSSKKLIGSYSYKEKYNSFGTFVMVNNIAYISTWRDGLLILDISDQTKPKRVGMYIENDTSIQDVYVENGIAYIADWNNGLQIIDVSNPSKLILLGSYNTGNASHVYVSNNIAFVTFGSNLELIDISDPSLPSLFGSINIGNEPSGIYVSGNYAYVGDKADSGKGFQVIDVSDPSNPVLVGQKIPAVCRQLMYVDGYIYALIGVDVYKIDISNPAAPSYEALFGGESTGPFYIADNKAYVNGDWAGGIDKDGILVVDLISMKIIELYTTAGGNFHFEDIKFSNGTLYMSLAGRGFYMYDPSKPAVISSLSKRKSEPGGVLAVNGKNFGEYQGVVLIKQNDKNQKADIVSWSDEKIDITLPTKLKSGSAVVRVKKSTDLKSRNYKTIQIKKSN